MDKTAFHQTLSQLAKRGLKIGGSEYSREAFGSWWIVVKSDPAIRLVWEGKDGWLIL